MLKKIYHQLSELILDSNEKKFLKFSKFKKKKI